MAVAVGMAAAAIGAGVVAAGAGVASVGAGAARPSGLLFPRFIIRRHPITIHHRHTTHIRRVLHTDIPPATTAPAEQHSTSNHMSSRVTAV